MLAREILLLKASKLRLQVSRFLVAARATSPNSASRSPSKPWSFFFWNESRSICWRLRCLVSLSIVVNEESSQRGKQQREKLLVTFVKVINFDSLPLWLGTCSLCVKLMDWCLKWMKSFFLRLFALLCESLMHKLKAICTEPIKSEKERETFR